MRSLCVALLALLAAFCAWWWIDDGVRAPSVAPVATDRMDGALQSPSSASLGADTRVAENDAAVQREAVIVPSAAVADGGWIRGIVIGPDGGAVEGARIVAETSDAEEYPLLDATPRQRRAVGEATSAPDGSYEVRVANDTTHVVHANAPGFAPAVRGDCRAGSQVDFRLERGAALEGVVRRAADGVPVEGAEIVVAQSLGSTSWRCGAATTDAAGHYRIDGLPSGSCTVAVEPRVLAPPRDGEVVLFAGHTTTHDVNLVDGITIRGHVLEATSREPIAGARVTAGWRGRSVASGADGAFGLPGFDPNDNVILTVEADGFASLEVALRDGGTAADRATDVEVLLQRGRRATGRVVDERGAPLANVYVAGVAADASNQQFRHDWRATRSASDGTFAIDGLRPDLPHELLLLRRGLATAVYAFPDDEMQRATIELGDFTMQPPSTVSGRVVDENGAPASDHPVILQGANADRRRGAAAPADAYRAIDSYVAERRCRTDDAGRFRFVDLAAGDYTIATPRFDSHDTVSDHRTVARAVDVSGVELRLFRGLAIEGSVFVGDGKALPKCYCSIDPEDGQGTSGDVEVGADGRFRAAGLAAGNYTVTVYPYGSAADRESGRTFAPRAITHVAAGATSLRCEVPVFLSIRGVVLDAQRAPLQNAKVDVFAGTARLASLMTDANGAFTAQVPFGTTVDVVASANGREARATAAAGAPPLELQL